MKNIKTAGLFSGGGGLDLGFAAAGFDLAFSTDFEPDAIATLQRNEGKRCFPNHPALCADVRELTGAKVERIAGGPINCVIGGPPCQSFSVAGKRLGEADERGLLVWQFARIVGELEPEVFAMENVANLKNYGVLDDLERRFAELGYAVALHEYNMANHGIPQFRRRIFLVGSRTAKIPTVPITHGMPGFIPGLLKPWVTVIDAIAGIPHGANGHQARSHSERMTRVYGALGYGERPPKLRTSRAHPDRPGYAVTGASGGGGGNSQIHPSEPRMMTPREVARLQTFPDWWEFEGSYRSTISQVGNAVPPLFAALLASQIARGAFDILETPNPIDALGLDYLRPNKNKPPQAMPAGADSKFPISPI